MLEKNQKITLTGQEALDALKEVEYILISLHKMGSFYAEKPGALEEYRKSTTDFIDDCSVTQRLSKVRRIISQHFDDSLGDDEMDDLERHFSDLEFWKPDQPLGRKDHGMDILKLSKLTIQQITCKRNELLVIVTDEQDNFLLITFHSPSAFQGVSAIGTEIREICEGGDLDSLQDANHISVNPNKKSYCFKANNDIFTVIADSYYCERI